jgi:hypothetical protein
MFCNKCGKETVGDEKYCTQCGTKLERQNINPGGEGGAYGNGNKVHIGQNPNALWAADAILFILSWVLMLTKTFTASVWGFGESISIFELIELNWLKVVFIFVSLAASVLELMPAATKKTDMINIAVPMIVSGISLIGLIIVEIEGLSQAGGLGASFSFSFSGWLALICCICTILLKIKILSEKKKCNK